MKFGKPVEDSKDKPFSLVRLLILVLTMCERNDSLEQGWTEQ